jgi:hypothetical protein
MAWTARIDTISPSQNKLTLNVSYFDAVDTGFTTQLGSQSFTFDANVTLTAARNQIIAAAKEFRTSYNLISTYTGVTINVP